MDFIDDVDDDDVAEESTVENEGSASDKILADLHNALFIEIMKLKPVLRKQKTSSAAEVVIPKEVAVVVAEEIIASFTNVVQFKERLLSAKFDHVKIIPASALAACNEMFDIIIDVTSFTLNNQSITGTNVIELFQQTLMPGGALLTINSNAFVNSNFSVFDWVLPELKDAKSEMKTVIVVRKRCIHCNEIGAIYWHPIPSKKDKKLCQSVIDRERAWIELVSVPVSVHEYETGVFSDATHNRAVQNILQYGVCLFPHLFDPKETKDWGRYALEDMKNIVDKLSDRGIDLLHPSEANPRIENYHEMSMREALRCDLRNGKGIKQKSAEVYGAEKKVTSVYKEPTNYHTHLPASRNIRFHPAIRAVLAEAMNPPAPTEHERKGNWGRYNFEGPGPEVIPEPKIGSVGVVMSLPGCADQTIHADTSHTYVHTHLPPHYLNLFTPAIDREKNAVRPVEGSSKMQYESFAVGQTSFVVGSHTLDMCGRVMTTDEGQLLLEERLIRPQLTAGDALIFDCRVLHFGLANQANNDKVVDESSGLAGASDGTFGWRPMLYVNYHQDWFHDPKNWNDNEKLFDDNN